MKMRVAQVHCSHQILLSEMILPGIEVLIWKVVTQNIREIGEEPLYKTMQSCLVALVRCVVNFGTISIRYVQLVKQKLLQACRLAVSDVRCVYEFRNYLFEFLQQSGTQPSAA